MDRPMQSTVFYSPALQKIQADHDAVETRLERLRADIDERHEGMKLAQEMQDQDVRSMRAAEVELRAYKQVLHTLRSGEGVL